MPRTVLIYGESGTYKSTNLGEIAEYLLERYGGICRLITADSGSSPMQEQIDRGVIIPWDLTTCEKPMGLFRKAVQGYWPSVLVNGRADENKFKLTTPQEWEGISGYLIEGVTRIADLMMQDLKNKRRDTGEPLQAKFEDAGVEFAQSSRGTYGFVQAYTQDWIGDLKKLRCPWIIVTGHEGKGEDLVTKKTIFGPAIVGKAGTDKVCGWFENTIHTESYRYTLKNKQGGSSEEQGVRGLFIRHTDAEVPNVFWPAKLGVTPRIASQVLKSFPKGYVPFKMNEDGIYISGVHSLIKVIDDAAGVAAFIAEHEETEFDEFGVAGLEPLKPVESSASTSEMNVHEAGEAVRLAQIESVKTAETIAPEEVGKQGEQIEMFEGTVKKVGKPVKEGKKK